MPELRQWSGARRRVWVQGMRRRCRRYDLVPGFEQEYKGEDGAEGTLDLVSGDKLYRRSRRRTEYIQF